MVVSISVIAGQALAATEERALRGGGAAGVRPHERAAGGDPTQSGRARQGYDPLPAPSPCDRLESCPYPPPCQLRGLTMSDRLVCVEQGSRAS